MATQTSLSIIGKRLREARKAHGIPQDRLGVLIGLDEATASARISRYESGVHEPPFQIMENIAKVLQVPVSYFYCPDDLLARLIQCAGEAAPGAIQEAVFLLEHLSNPEEAGNPRDSGHPTTQPPHA